MSADIPAIKFWRVNLQGARKPHLTLYVQAQGTGSRTLCQKDTQGLINQKRSSELISEPDGKECNVCLQLAGFLLKRPNPQAGPKTPLENWIKCFKGMLKLMPPNLTPDQKGKWATDMLNAIKQISPMPKQ